MITIAEMNKSCPTNYKELYGGCYLGGISINDIERLKAEDKVILSEGIWLRNRESGECGRIVHIYPNKDVCLSMENGGTDEITNEAELDQWEML